MIMSFGIFAAILIIVNYLLIISIMPSVYVFHEMHIRKSAKSDDHIQLRNAI